MLIPGRLLFKSSLSTLLLHHSNMQLPQTGPCKIDSEVGAQKKVKKPSVIPLCKSVYNQP